MGNRTFIQYGKKNLLGVVKGKGFYCIEQELNFWEFYLKVEDLKLGKRDFLSNDLTPREVEYMVIKKNIGFKVQEEMKKIKM